MIQFKQTPIGEIPDEWDVVRLEDVVEINKKSKDPTKAIPDDKFFYVDIESIEGGTGVIKTAKEIFGKDAPSRARRVVHQNDVIMSTVRPYLKAFAIVPKEYDNQICSTGFAVLSCRKKILPHYLLYTLFSKAIIEQCSRMMVGGQYPALNQSKVKNLQIPLPPLPEQHHIAEILTTADTAIRKVDDAIAKTERLKRGLMQELLTQGVGHEEFKESEVGRIPRGWDVVKLEDVLELCQYGLSVKMSDEGKYPIVRVDEIENGNVVSEITKYVDLDEKTLINFKLEKGDILFNRITSYELVGRTGIFLHDGDYVFASYLIRLRPKHEIVDPLFLTLYLIFSNGRLRQLATRAVHQANINATNLKKFKVSFPEKIEEQRKIAEILSTIDKKLELERKRKKKLERVKSGLMNGLIGGKVRVKNCEVKND